MRESEFPMSSVTASLSPAQRSPHSAEAPGRPARGDAGWWGSLGLLAVAWLLVFNQQRLEWSVNPTYGYGWAVPFLALFLFWERWRRRPEAQPTRWMAWLVIPAVALLAYLPVRVIQEANPDWVKINWSLAGVPIVLSFAALFALGGLRYAWFFAFPVLFCLTALPWPVWMEEYLVQSLTRGNATISAEILTVFGMPAFAKGNLIQVGTSWVNVEEACSGIRSLQTALMVSLFFGEYYRFGFGARVALLLSSFAVAFVLNLARTMFLTYLTGVGGTATMEKWHDTVGNVAMIACLVALWLLAEAVQRWSRKKELPAESAPSQGVFAGIRPHPFPLWFAAVGVVWLAASEGVTAWWYASHEQDMPAAHAWTLAWPDGEPGFRRSEFAERTKAILKYNEAETAAWRTAEGYRWQMYYIRWYPGRVSKFLSRSHYPTVCLPATGWKLIAETGRFDQVINGVRIPFATYLFDENGRDVHVFHAIVEDNPAMQSGETRYYQASSEERIASVLRRERNLGQRVIGVALTGPVIPTDARDALTGLLEQMIVPGETRVAAAK